MSSDLRRAQLLEMINMAIEAKDFRSCDVFLREFPIEGAFPEDLIALLLSTRVVCDELQSFPKISRQSLVKLREVFSEIEIRELLST
jgi:hypothetical protein